jgi:hypothetical protein
MRLCKDDVELYEINEAFAVVTAACTRHRDSLPRRRRGGRSAGRSGRSAIGCSPSELRRFTTRPCSQAARGRGPSDAGYAGMRVPKAPSWPATY